MMLKRTAALASILVACFSTAINAQQVGTDMAQPQDSMTQLERFQTVTGTVVLVGFRETGRISGHPGGGSAIVESRMSEDATSGQKVYGITVQIREVNRIERKNTSFVDYGEIDSLLKGIDYLLNLTSEASPLPLFQATYRTRGDLAVSVFNQAGSTDLLAEIESGTFGKTTIFCSVEDLKSVRGFIAQAREILNSLQGKK